MSNNDTSSFFSVFISNSTRHIDLDEAIRVSTSSFEVNLVVARKIEKKLEEPYSNCRLYVEFKLASLKSLKFSYQQSDCLNLCHLREVAKKCNQIGNFNTFADYFFVNMSRFLNFYDEMTKQCRLEDSSLWNSDDLLLKQIKSGVCENDCPSECYTVSYAVSAHYNFLFGQEFVNKTSINVYFETFKYRVISQIPKSKSEDLFAGIGGILGVVYYWLSCFDALRI